MEEETLFRKSTFYGRRHNVENDVIVVSFNKMTKQMS